MRKINQSFIISIIIIAIFIFMAKRKSFAHKVNIFAYVEGMSVFTESYFNDGKKCQNCELTIFDEQGNQLLTGKTNSNGEFSFKSPCVCDLKIVLNAGLGHSTQCIVSAHEFSDFNPKEDKAIIEQDNEINKKESNMANQNHEMREMSHLEIKNIIEEALDKKLAPLLRFCAKEEADKGISMSDVIAGIGYIFGIMGIIFIFKVKKKS